jgi:hypothetical protein
MLMFRCKHCLRNFILDWGLLIFVMGDYDFPGKHGKGLGCMRA